MFWMAACNFGPVVARQQLPAWMRPWLAAGSHPRLHGKLDVIKRVIKRN